MTSATTAEPAAIVTTGPPGTLPGDATPPEPLGPPSPEPVPPQPAGGDAGGSAGPPGGRDVEGQSDRPDGGPTVRRRMATSPGRRRRSPRTEARAERDAAPRRGAPGAGATAGLTPEPIELSGEELEGLGSFPPPTPWSERLAEENLNLARKIAREWSFRCRESYDDLEAVAFRGLLNGCRRFDPNRGTTLGTCCHRYIHGSIKQWLRDRGHRFKLPIAWREAWGRMSHELAQGRTYAEAAAAVGLPTEAAEQMAAAVAPPLELMEGVDGASGHHWEPEIEDDALAPLAVVLRQALDRVRGQDRQLLILWDADPSRRVFPVQSLTALLRCVSMLRQGAQLATFRQQGLAGIVQTEQVGARRPARRRRQRNRRPRTAVELRAAAGQMGLLPMEDVPSVG